MMAAVISTKAGGQHRYPSHKYHYNPSLILPISSKPKSSSKLITNPISPETSTNENPMKAYRNNSSIRSYRIQVENIVQDCSTT